ncbi:LysR family transcriptional regulator [Paenibacillus glacialis]|uniref:HTH lysR-type domain-containing protein n=1 Tax=Paenibacillus glacialis TaxID=494026 RepID=A0A168FA58_9BACL|nr:LysR family transcriptional regulator [Paenibacillus glacialis]OAB36002.1 hypothetical protein PGLA_21490 [Paenibacillus glacialis]
MKTIERMKTFLVLAECGSYVETAKRLYCSQPTISNHIQQLEKQFQASLFHRSDRKVQLTEQGFIVQEHIKQVISLLQDASTKVQHSLLQHEQILSIYISSYISECYLPDILARYHQSFPKQLLEIHTYCYEDLQRSLLVDGKAYFAFLPIYPEDDQLYAQYDATFLFEEELPLIVPADHPWARRKLLYTRDLHRETILIPQSKYICQYIKQQMQLNHIKVRYLQMSTFNMIKQSIKVGLGVSFLPYEVVKKELDTGELVALPISSLQIKRSNGLVIRKNTQLRAEEQTFCHEVQAYFSSLDKVAYPVPLRINEDVCTRSGS